MKYIKKFENIDWDNDWDFEENYPIPNDFKGHEDFYNFLVKNNILDKFLKNFNDSEQINWRKRINLKIKLQDYLNSCDVYEFILKAFNWSKTPEENTFWYSINYFNFNKFLDDNHI